MRGRDLITIGVVLVIVLAGGWLLVDSSPPPSPQPSFPPMTEVVGTRGLNFDKLPLWLSDHEILCLSGRAVLDTRTGQQRPLTNFQRLFLPGGRLAEQPPSDGGYLSPDKKWLLWSGGIGSYQTYRGYWIAARLDGSRVVTVMRPQRPVDAPSFAWMPDSRHWVEADCDVAAIGHRTRINVYGLDTPTVKSYTVPWPVLGAHLFFAPNGDGLLFSLAMGAAPIQLFHFRLQSTPRLIGTTTYQLPAIYAPECAVSPSGNQVAWVLYRVRLSPRRNLAERAAAWLTHTQTEYARSVWVSGLDGSGLRQVVPDAFDSPGWSVGNIQWTPDGRHLCIRHDDALWTVPVAGL